MSYPPTNQDTPGTMDFESKNPKTQPGSRANQEASNSAQNPAVATSDHYPVTESKNRTNRGSGDPPGQDSRGYVKSLANSPTPRKVGVRPTRKRM